MTAASPLLELPQIETAIDDDFQTVAPDTPLSTVITWLSNTRQQKCDLNTNYDEVLEGDTAIPATTMRSFVLVVEAGQLVGIFTERDIVRLSLSPIDWQTTEIASVMTHPVITLNSALFQDIFAALFLFRRYKIRHLPIVETDGTIIGVVSPESIRNALQPANLLKLRRVTDVMTKHVHYLPPTATVREAAQLMTQKRVSCVVIVRIDEDEHLHPLGIVTERDIVQFQFLELDLATTTVQDVMSAPLYILDPQDSLWDAHQAMNQRRVRRLVVSWNWGRGLGIVTQTSILRVFDPIEMYGIIETLQKQSETEEVDTETSVDLESWPHAANWQPQSSSPSTLTTLIQVITTLQNLLDTPELPRWEQEQQLQAALAQTTDLRDRYIDDLEELPPEMAIAWPDEPEPEAEILSS